MAKTHFKEKQRYTNKIIPIILGLIGIITIWKGFNFLLEPQPDYYKAAFLFAAALTIGGFIWWLTKVELKVTITKKGIKFKMSPNHSKKRFLAWDEIEKCELVKTSEAAQWSGGNITYNHEKRVSLTGRNGLAIKTKNGEYYFIGSNDLEGLQDALSQIERFKK